MVSIPYQQLSRHHLFHAFLFAIAYFAFAELGHALSFPGDFASFWPPSGLLLAILLIVEAKRWPVFIIAALAGNVFSDVAFHGKTIPVSFGFSLANILDALTTSLILRWLIGFPFNVLHLRHVLWFVFVIAVGGSVGASIGAGVVTTAFGASYWATWPVWWMSGVLGEMILTPAIVHLVGTKPWRGLTRVAIAELIIMLVATFGLAEFIFATHSGPLAYFMLPIFMWAAFRCGIFGATLANMVATLVIVWNTSNGYGPFAEGRPILAQVLLTQAFLVTLTSISIFLATLVHERAVAWAATKQVLRELEYANAQLKVLASSDALTGLYNRGALNRKLDEEVGRAKRYQLPFSILLLDVDYFKRFNDSFGHPAGDEVLRQVARLLQLATRSTDFVARYGGEEFAILLPQTSEPSAMIVAERIREAIAKADWPHRPITVSIGVATLSPHLSSGSLVQLADDALYQAKTAGRNRVSHINRVAAEPASQHLLTAPA